MTLRGRVVIAVRSLAVGLVFGSAPAVGAVAGGLAPRLGFRLGLAFVSLAWAIAAIIYGDRARSGQWDRIPLQFLGSGDAAATGGTAALTPRQRVVIGARSLAAGLLFGTGPVVAAILGEMPVGRTVGWGLAFVCLLWLGAATVYADRARSGEWHRIPFKFLGSDEAGPRDHQGGRE